MSTVSDIIEKIQFKVDTAEEELNTIMPPWVDSIVQYIAMILFKYKSDLIEGSFSKVFAIDDDHKALDSDCWGLMGKPWIDGETKGLLPITDQSQILQYADTGTPLRYQLVGQTLYLYPGTSVERTIKGKYFKKPATISGVTSVIPFFGLFDILIEELVLEAYKIANPTVGRLDQFPRNATKYLNSQKINAGVESVVLGRQANNPQGPYFNSSIV